MHRKTIRNLCASAQVLVLQKDMVGAFALYWIAWEGLCVRAAVKALWLRGCTVRDSEKFLNKHSTGPFVLLGQTANIRVIQSEHPIIRLFWEINALRNDLFHKASVHKKDIEAAVQALSMCLADPKCAFADILVCLDKPGDKGNAVPMGDPLARLTRSKTVKRAVKTQPEDCVDKIHFTFDSAPGIRSKRKPLLTDNAILELFVKKVSAAKHKAFITEYRSSSSKPPLTDEERKRKREALRLEDLRRSLAPS
ncbi:MAG: hypothetical protein JW384_03380 [Nitrosomonadaceae bacterium]|nr:hypothetical protein [Nitrosomonadaceae bacterium]